MALVITTAPQPFVFSFLELAPNPSPDQHFEQVINFTYSDHGGSASFTSSYNGLTTNFGNIDRDGANPAVIDLFIKDTNPVTGGIQGIEILSNTTGRMTVGYDLPFEYYNRLGAGEIVLVRTRLTITDTFASPDETDTIDVHLQITGVNDLPTAINDAINVSDGVSRFDNGAVLANDKDVDIKDIFTVTAVGAATAAVAIGGTILPVEYVAQTPGTATLDANSVIVDFNRYYKFLAPGESVRFNVPYTMADGHGGSSVANVVTTITGTATKTFKGTGASEQMLGENDGDKMLGDDGNDTIFARGGNDEVDGEKGNDIIVGGLGADDLFGDKGADIFRLLTTLDSGKKGSQRDAIFDFDSKDKVDLSPIDPIAGGVDDVFKWRGTKNFSGTGPEVNYDKKGSKVILFGDADGDGKADFSMQFNGLNKLEKGDFDL